MIKYILLIVFILGIVLLDSNLLKLLCMIGAVLVLIFADNTPTITGGNPYRKHYQTDFN